MGFLENVVVADLSLEGRQRTTSLMLFVEYLQYSALTRPLPVGSALEGSQCGRDDEILNTGYQLLSDTYAAVHITFSRPLPVRVWPVTILGGDAVYVCVPQTPLRSCWVSVSNGW